MSGNRIGYVKGKSKFGSAGYKPGGMISAMNRMRKPGAPKMTKKLSGKIIKKTLI